MAEPSLSELSNIKVDPEIATGNSGVVYDNWKLVGLFNQAANVKAENDWRKYTTFLGNLKDVYKDINEIAKTPVMASDSELFRNQMGDIVKEIGKDPKSFFGGGPKYQEILGKVSKLQQDATQSKQDNIFDTAHRAYFYRNPDLDTPENRKMIEGFATAKLGVRQPYQMQLPGFYDPDQMAKTLNEVVKSESPYGPVLSADQQFYDTGVETVHDPVKYRKLAEAMYEQVDKRGVPIAQTVQTRFDALPSDIKGKYKNAKEFFVEDLVKRVLPSSRTKETKPNPNYLEKERLAQKAANDRAEIGLGYARIAEDKRQFDETPKTKTGAAITTGVSGNALNGIPLKQGMTDGEHNLSKEDKAYLGQLQNVLGDKVISNDMIQEAAGMSDAEKNIKIKVSGGQVQSIRVGGKWYNRQEIENLQKQRDKEAKGSDHQQYPLEQSYIGGKPTTSTIQGPTTQAGLPIFN